MRFNLLKAILYVLIGVILVPIIFTLGWSYFGTWHRTSRPSQPIAVYVPGTGLVQMDLEEYIKGVVAAEMPANFELEALKAQAVAARTYAVRKMRANGGPGCDKHPGADICTDPSHGQAWVSFEDLKRRYGFFTNLRVLAKIDKAVEETRGIVATYAGRPIDAIYHSNSGGVTEDSENVWGNYIPYLRSVKTSLPPHERVIDRKTFSISQISSLLGVNLAKADLARARQLLPGESIPVTGGQNRPQLEVLERSKSGRVVSLYLGGVKVRGIDFRQRLGLKSTNFTWTVHGDEVTFTTLGNGHGVGMCQYSANAMARAGVTYDRILKHFYTGIDLTYLKDLIK
ncbi:MAG: stage II sporulation protein D [Firmicutes bacterium]|nr:stage II sporulation protein D [Bacillota bacterium]